MSKIVVDASVTLSWCFADEQSEPALKVLDRLKAGDQALVPVFWAVEVLNSLLLGERRGRISIDDTSAFLHNLLNLQPMVDYISLGQVVSQVQNICRGRRLTPYDALYVELAMRSGCPLATLDREQKRAAETLGIECL